MFTALGRDKMENFVDMVADAQGSHTDELGAVVLELEYLREEQEGGDEQGASGL